MTTRPTSNRPRPRWEVGVQSDDGHWTTTVDDRHLTFVLGAGYEPPTVTAYYADYVCESDIDFSVSKLRVHVEDEAAVEVREHHHVSHLDDFVSIDLGGGVTVFVSSAKADEIASALTARTVIDHATNPATIKETA